MGKSLSKATANVNFRQQLRRAVSNTKAAISDPNGTQTNGMDEETPLLDGGQQADRRSVWRRVFFDTKKTPGMDSSQPLVKAAAHVWNVTKLTLISSPVNILLFFVPIGIVAGKQGWGSTAVFTLNFLAIIPLAAVLSFATEEISKRLGDALGGLLNATFGNAVELIVSIVALRAGEIEVVQSSMLGSILSNMLLVMGMCFFLGGVFNMGQSGSGLEQSFSSGTAQTACSLMALSSASLIIPAALYGLLDRSGESDKQASILMLSRSTAIILLLLYVMYLFFQLRTHSNLFVPAREDEEEAEEHEPLISPWSAAIILILVTIVISECADYMVDSIDDIVATGKISKNFIGLILIPIVGNAAEHVTACVVAIKNNMDLAMGVAIGSSIQIALLVTPFLVILGWILGQPMSLHFETFETIAFTLGVLVVTYTVQDGKSNYLEGAMLVGLYVIIAVAFWVSPADALSKAFGY